MADPEFPDGFIYMSLSVRELEFISAHDKYCNPAVTVQVESESLAEAIEELGESIDNIKIRKAAHRLELRLQWNNRCTRDARNIGIYTNTLMNL